MYGNESKVCYFCAVNEEKTECFCKKRKYCHIFTKI